MYIYNKYIYIYTHLSSHHNKWALSFEFWAWSFELWVLSSVLFDKLRACQSTEIQSKGPFLPSFDMIEACQRSTNGLFGPALAPALLTSSSLSTVPKFYSQKILKLESKSSQHSTSSKLVNVHQSLAFYSIFIHLTSSRLVSSKESYFLNHLTSSKLVSGMPTDNRVTALALLCLKRAH